MLLTLLTILKLPIVLTSLAILISLTPLLTLLTCTIQPLLTLLLLTDINNNKLHTPITFLQHYFPC